MAVYSTLSTIKNQMLEADARFWAVEDSQGNDIAESNQVLAKDQTADSSFEKLKKVLDECSGDYVKVTIRTKPANRDEDGNYKTGNTRGQRIFKYNVACTPVSGQPINGTGDKSLLDEIYRLKDQIRENEFKQRYEALERRIEGITAEKKDNSIIEKFLGQVANNIADKITGKEIKRILNKDKEEPEDEPEETAPEEGRAEATEGSESEVKDAVVDLLKNTSKVMGDEKATIDAIKALTKFIKNKPELAKETIEQLKAQ